jgi:hypothetical protein
MAAGGSLDGGLIEWSVSSLLSPKKIEEPKKLYYLLSPISHPKSSPLNKNTALAADFAELGADWTEVFWLSVKPMRPGTSPTRCEYCYGSIELWSANMYSLNEARNFRDLAEDLLNLSVLVNTNSGSLANRRQSVRRRP